MSHRHSEAIFPNCCCYLLLRDAWTDKDQSPGGSQTANSQPLRATSFSKTGKARKLQLQTPLAPTLQSRPFGFDSNGPKALIFSEAAFLPGRICGFLQCSVAQGHAGRHVAVAPFALGCRSAAAGQGKSSGFCDRGDLMVHSTYFLIEAGIVPLHTISRVVDTCRLPSAYKTLDFTVRTLLPLWSFCSGEAMPSPNRPPSPF